MGVDGRIERSNLNYNAKHPVIIPKSSPIAELLVRHSHVTKLHTGVDATFINLRQQYWTLGARNIVRKSVFQCKRCFLQRKSTSSQIMGEHHTGLDYAGPISIKGSTGRTPMIGKAWFAMLVCLSTKALHIEAVTDLTTKAFIAAFQRFIARDPNQLISTQTTVPPSGSKRVLDEMRLLAMEQRKDENLANFFANKGILWHFIPPCAPHFGEIWEAGVWSIKLHMKRIMSTVLIQIEDLSKLSSFLLIRGFYFGSAYTGPFFDWRSLYCLTGANPSRRPDQPLGTMDSTTSNDPRLLETMAYGVPHLSARAHQMATGRR